MQALQTLGALMLDCDEIYHGLLLSSNEMRAKLKERFENVSTDGKIDRQKLSEIVWNDPAALHELSAITHGFVADEIDRKIADFKAQGGMIAAIDAIALIESGQSEKCDVVIGIIAPQEKRILRIMDRDNITRDHALLRINAQQTESFYHENCDYVLDNTFDTQDEFVEKCVEFFKGCIPRDAQGRVPYKNGDTSFAIDLS
jgi:dephospho-CoA kinase